MNLDLSPQSLFHFRCFYHTLVQFFNSHFNATGPVKCELYLPVRALAQGDAFELELVQLHVR